MPPTASSTNAVPSHIGGRRAQTDRAWMTPKPTAEKYRQPDTCKHTLLQSQDRGHCRYATRIDKKQHVMAWWRNISVGRSLNIEPVLRGFEGQTQIALVGVEVVRNRTQSEQRNAGYPRSIGGRNREACVVGNQRRYRRD